MVDVRWSARWRRPAAVLLAATAIVALVAGCGTPTRSARLPRPTGSTAATSAGTSTAGDSPSAATTSEPIAATPSTPPPTVDGSTITDWDSTVAGAPIAHGGCEYAAVGAALRPTVKVSGATVTISAGALGCAEGVTVYVADYLLTNDPAQEPEPTLAGSLTPGGPPLTLTFPSSFAQCRATAVYFETVSADPTEAHLQIRQEVSRWPASTRAYAPTAAYVARYPKTRILLARNISGLDPCSSRDAERITTPQGKVGACWNAGPDSQPGRPEYVEVSCGHEHLYEVYYVKSITFAQYKASGSPHDPDAWAQKLSRRTCSAKQSSIRFSGNYRISNLGTTYVWPAGLSALGDDGTAFAGGWEGAQIICLVRRADDQPVTKRILR